MSVELETFAAVSAHLTALDLAGGQRVAWRVEGGTHYARVVGDGRPLLVEQADGAWCVVVEAWGCRVHVPALWLRRVCGKCPDCQRRNDGPGCAW